MRRTDRAITQREAIDAIIQRCSVCRLGLTAGQQAYIVPLFFGYDGARLYVHCAHDGLKLELLRQNPLVCVEFDVLLGIERGATPCQWSARYQSVIGFGTARIVTSVEEKQAALSLIMAHYGAPDARFTPEEAQSVTILCIELEEVSGKQRL